MRNLNAQSILPTRLVVKNKIPFEMVRYQSEHKT